MKKVGLFFMLLLCVVGLVSMTVQKSIRYGFGAEIEVRIDSIANSFKTEGDLNLFLTMVSSRRNTFLLVINSYEKGRIQKELLFLIKHTNRVYESKGIKMPIIFDTDSFHSADSNWTVIPAGGYVEIGRFGEFIGVGNLW